MDEPDFDNLKKVDVKDLNRGDSIVYFHRESGKIGAGEVIDRLGPDLPYGTLRHAGYYYARVVSYHVEVSLQITDSRFKLWRAEPPSKNGKANGNDS